MIRTKISPEEFIHAWQTSDSLEEVCRKLDLNNGACHCRAYMYRRIGINLKEFPKGKKVLDAAKLNELAQSLLPKE